MSVFVSALDFGFCYVLFQGESLCLAALYWQSTVIRQKPYLCMLRYWGEEASYNMMIISLFSVSFVFGLWQHKCFSSLLKHFFLHSDKTERFQEAEVWAVPSPAWMRLWWRVSPWRADLCYGEGFEHISQRLPLPLFFFSCHDLRRFFSDLHFENLVRILEGKAHGKIVPS